MPQTTDQHRVQQTVEGSIDHSASAGLATLTEREREVLRTFVVLLNDKKVALHLGTKGQTVRNQINSILHKLNVSSRLELLALVHSSPALLRALPISHDRTIG
jgi:DNA-binding CsgD family transcriptional regulator